MTRTVLIAVCLFSAIGSGADEGGAVSSYEDLKWGGFVTQTYAADTDAPRSSSAPDTNYRSRLGQPPQGPDVALDVFDPAADFGEIDPDHIVVRFQPATAAKLHVERAVQKLRAGQFAMPLESVKSSLPPEIIGFAPFVSGGERAEAMMGSASPGAWQKIHADQPLSVPERDALEKAIETQSASYGPEGLFLAKVRTGAEVIDLCRRLHGLDDVVYAEPSVVCHPYATANDTYFTRMWHLSMIHVPTAWDLTSAAASGLRVCVVDTGVRLDHAELAGRIAEPVDVYLDNGNAYGNNNPDDDDENGHGTACAGIIAAIRNNNSLVSGIAPVTIVPVSGGGYSNTGHFVIFNYTDGVMAGVNRNSRIISLSLGGARNGPGQAELDAAQYAANNGVLVFAATGNGNTDADTNYPSAISSYVAVGAVDSTGARVQNPPWWWGSNWGNTVDITAPGQGDVGNFGDSILTIGPSSSTAFRNDFNGTSAATPIAAGVGALVMLTDPALTAAQVRQILEQTAVDQVGSRSQDTPGWDPHHGHGLVDAQAAVERAAPTAPVLAVSPQALQVPTGQGSKSVTVTNTGTGTMTWSAAVTTGGTWLSVSNPTPQNQNPGSFNVNFTSNTTGAARTGEITVTAPGATGSPRTVSVTQESEAGSLASLEITSGDVTDHVDNDGDSYASIVKVSVVIQKTTQAGDPIEALTRIYAQDPVSLEWIYGGEAETSAPVLGPHAVVWNWPVFEGEPRGLWNFRVEVYRAGQDDPDDVRSNANESNFAGIALEPPGDDAVMTANSVQLVNNTGEYCTVLNVSPVTSTVWGNNFLNTDVAPGTSRTIGGIQENNYDLRVIFEGGQRLVLWDQAIYGGGTFVWNLSLEGSDGANTVRVLNDGGIVCSGVYISPTSSPYWGANRLDSVLAGGAYRDFSGFQDDAYDMLTEFSNGQERVQWAVVLQGGQRFDWHVTGGGSNPPPGGGCGKSFGVKLPDSVTEQRLPSSANRGTPAGQPVAVRVTASDPIDFDSLRVKSTVDVPVRNEWLPASADGRDGWLLITHDGDLDREVDAVVAVYATTVDGTPLEPRVEVFRILPATADAPVDDIVEATDVAPPLGGANRATYRLSPELPYAEPRAFHIPVAAGTRAGDVMLQYHSESGAMAGWYDADQVIGWLASDAMQVIEYNGETYLEILVNHGGVVHVGGTSYARASVLPVGPATDDGAGDVVVLILTAIVAFAILARRTRRVTE